MQKFIKTFINIFLSFLFVVNMLPQVEVVVKADSDINLDNAGAWVRGIEAVTYNVKTIPFDTPQEAFDYLDSGEALYI